MRGDWRERKKRHNSQEEVILMYHLKVTTKLIRPFKFTDELFHASPRNFKEYIQSDVTYIGTDFLGFSRPIETKPNKGKKMIAEQFSNVSWKEKPNSFEHKSRMEKRLHKIEQGIKRYNHQLSEMKRDLKSCETKINEQQNQIKECCRRLEENDKKYSQEVSNSFQDLFRCISEIYYCRSKIANRNQCFESFSDSLLHAEEMDTDSMKGSENWTSMNMDIHPLTNDINSTHCTVLEDGYCNYETSTTIPSKEIEEKQWGNIEVNNYSPCNRDVIDSTKFHNLGNRRRIFEFNSDLMSISGNFSNCKIRLRISEKHVKHVKLNIKNRITSEKDGNRSRQHGCFLNLTLIKDSLLSTSKKIKSGTTLNGGVCRLWKKKFSFASLKSNFLRNKWRDSSFSSIKKQLFVLYKTARFTNSKKMGSRFLTIGDMAKSSSFNAQIIDVCTKNVPDTRIVEENLEVTSSCKDFVENSSSVNDRSELKKTRIVSSQQKLRGRNMHSTCCDDETMNISNVCQRNRSCRFENDLENSISSSDNSVCDSSGMVFVPRSENTKIPNGTDVKNKETEISVSSSLKSDVSFDEIIRMSSVGKQINLSTTMVGKECSLVSDWCTSRTNEYVLNDLFAVSSSSDKQQCFGCSSVSKGNLMTTVVGNKSMNRLLKNQNGIRLFVIKEKDEKKINGIRLGKRKAAEELWEINEFSDLVCKKRFCENNRGGWCNGGISIRCT